MKLDWGIEEDRSRIISLIGDDPKAIKTALAILTLARKLEQSESAMWGYIEFGQRFVGEPEYILRGFLSGVKGSLSRRISQRRKELNSICPSSEPSSEGAIVQQKLFDIENY